MAGELTAISGDLALPKPALADKQCQEEAATKQQQADDKCIMALDMPPNHDTTIRWRIQAKFALHMAPLNAILTKIARNDIGHNA